MWDEYFNDDDFETYEYGQEVIIPMLKELLNRDPESDFNYERDYTKWVSLAITHIKHIDKRIPELQQLDEDNLNYE